MNVYINMYKEAYKVAKPRLYKLNLLISKLSFHVHVFMYNLQAKTEVGVLVFPYPDVFVFCGQIFFR